MQKPSLPKGTRDFGPVQMARRNYLFGVIRETFELYGYQQIETPSMENLSTLTGKYGDEGDQLLFKILNSGDFLKKTSKDDYEAGAKAMLSKIAEKGLRYDLTVPFARYVVMNRNDIQFPFKRYQIQPVWRADRPQKGRYREFFQCDADVVGTESLTCEAEIILMIRRVFEKLGLMDYSIKLNNRKVLTGIAQVMGAEGLEGPLCVAIDKLDKIGWVKVQDELLQRGFESIGIERLQPVIDLKGDIQSKIEFLRGFLKESEIGLQGLDEIEGVIQTLEQMGQDLDFVDFDVVLARGLSYYTGAIFEVKVNKVSIGSVSGGGRYDNLTGVFGMPNVPGVGFSFGVDRLYDVLNELDLFPDTALESTKVLFVHFDQKGYDYGLSLINQFREKGIRTEIYPDSAKVKKQFDYATKKGIPYVAICGDNEINAKTIALKNLNSGEQESLTLAEAINMLS
mgnify:CR=1 FL=1